MAAIKSDRVKTFFFLFAKQHLPVWEIFPVMAIFPNNFANPIKNTIDYKMSVKESI